MGRCKSRELKSATVASLSAMAACFESGNHSVLQGGGCSYRQGVLVGGKFPVDS